MTRVLIAVDGSELDAPLARTALRLFGADADYWAVNVQGYGAGAVPSTLPAMYGGSLVGFGMAYPFTAPEPYQVRGDEGADVVDAQDADAQDVDAQDVDAQDLAAATAASAVEAAGIEDAGRIVEVGDPPEAILRAARDHDIDVIVVGDHDRSWWSRLFAPAVASDLVDRAEVPVLVVSNRAAGAAEDASVAS